MNTEDRGILVGMVIGDGYLNVRHRIKPKGYEYESSELKVSHSTKQLDYAQHKANLIKKMFGGKCNIYYYETFLKATNKSYPMCAFMKSNSYFRILKKFIYKDKTKCITSEVLNMLTPHGIAIWYMDDGHARRNFNKDGFVSSVSTEISTYCTYEEANTIINWFKEKHGLDTKLFLSKGKYCIKWNTQASHEFARLVQPYIIPSMLYKLSHVADLSLHECRTSQVDEEIVRPNGN